MNTSPQSPDNDMSGLAPDQVSALCPQCKKQYVKTKTMKSFTKCSQVKDFVRRFENVQQLAGILLVKKSIDGELHEDDAAALEKATAILNNPDAKKRYQEVLEKRKKLSAQNKRTKNEDKPKKVRKSLIERASLDEDLIVPPSSKDVAEATDLNGGETTSSSPFDSQLEV